MNNPTKLIAIFRIATIIALAAAIAFSFVACASSTTRGGGGADSSLNGTWVNQAGEIWVFNNGSFTTLFANVESVRGTYTTSGNRITITISQVKGSAYGSNSAKIGILESQWYTKSQVRTVIIDYGVSQGLSQSQAAAIAETALVENTFYDPMMGTYSVDGDTLTVDGTILTRV